MVKFVETVQEKSSILPEKNIYENKSDSNDEFQIILSEKISSNEKVSQSEKNKSKIQKNKNKKLTNKTKEKESEDIKEVSEKKFKQSTEIEKLKQKIISALFYLKNIDKESYKKFVKDYLEERNNITDKHISLIEKISLMNYKKLLKLLADIKEEIKKVLAKKLFIPEVESSLAKENEKEMFVKKFTKKGKLVIENYTQKSQNSEPDIIKFDIKTPSSNDLSNNNIMNNPHSSSSILNKPAELMHNVSNSLPKIDLNDVFEQIVQKARISIMENKSDVIIKLKPEFLGKVVLKMELSGNKISGKIIVDNVFTHKLFIENLNQLKVSFQEMGLSIENFDIGLNNYNNFNFSENSFSERKVKLLGNKTISIDDDILEEIPDEIIADYELTEWLASNINLVA